MHKICLSALLLFISFAAISQQPGKAELEKTNEEELQKTWVLRNGDQILSKSQKVEVIRMAYCQIVHHRAQLGVFLRLLDVPIPGSYGPSADDANAIRTISMNHDH